MVNSVKKEKSVKQEELVLLTINELKEKLGVNKFVLISVSKSIKTNKDLYENTRKYWKVNIDKISQAELVIAENRGKLIGAFKPTKWMIVSAEENPLLAGRVYFEGDPAALVLDNIQNIRVIREKGNAAPVRYSW